MKNDLIILELVFPIFSTFFVHSLKILRSFPHLYLTSNHLLHMASLWVLLHLQLSLCEIRLRCQLLIFTHHFVFCRHFSTLILMSIWKFPGKFSRIQIMFFHAHFWRKRISHNSFWTMTVATLWSFLVYAKPNTQQNVFSGKFCNIWGKKCKAFGEVIR